MRTTLDLPDELLRRAKIAAIERGSNLRQLVTEALKRELDGPTATMGRRLTAAPIELAPDAPLRTLSQENVKQIDQEAIEQADVARLNALSR